MKWQINHLHTVLVHQQFCNNNKSTDTVTYSLINWAHLQYVIINRPLLDNHGLNFDSTMGPRTNFSITLLQYACSHPVNFTFIQFSSQHPIRNINQWSYTCQTALPSLPITNQHKEHKRVLNSLQRTSKFYIHLSICHKR